MTGSLWRVVGGGDRGGVVVREQRGTASPELPERLATGSVVAEKAVDRGRLHYELLSGRGPATGWVTLRLSGRDLLVPEADSSSSRAAASRLRIEKAAAWHEVLGLPTSAVAEEVKRAYRELALMHHPDKQADGDLPGVDRAEAFRAVQAAYEEGLAEVSSREVVELRQDTALCPVPVYSPKKRLHAACSDFEDQVDRGTSKSIPDDIPYVEVEEVVQWLREGKCVPIDAREPSERQGSNAAVLPGSVHLSYTQLLKSPETLVPQLLRLQDLAEAGMHLVSYSQHGSPSRGNHAIVCCLLVDVFGFDLQLMSSLEDGYLRWREWAKENPKALEELRSRSGSPDAGK